MRIQVSVETCERNIWLLQNLAGRIFVLWMTSIVSKRDKKKPSTFSRRFFQLNPPLRVGEIIFDGEIRPAVG